MITVLRLGHRIERDKRLTTHVALISRALGADKILFTGQHDKSLIDSINKITEKFGGPFSIEYIKNYKELLNKNSEIIHLTVYGIPLSKVINKIRKSKKDKIIIIGSEKVPPEIYHIANYNVSITNQPHSEAGALSIFLHELFKGKYKEFKNYKIKIISKEKGKKIIKS